MAVFCPAGPGPVGAADLDQPLRQGNFQFAAGVGDAADRSRTEAIAQFHQDNGRYPSDLGELTPRYLLTLPPPVVVRNGSWCYQGSEDYYRLGYISGQFTYFKADFQVEIHAQAGAPPPGFWICNQWAAKYHLGKLGY